MSAFSVYDLFSVIRQVAAPSLLPFGYIRLSKINVYILKTSARAFCVKLKLTGVITTSNEVQKSRRGKQDSACRASLQTGPCCP